MDSIDIHIQELLMFKKRLYQCSAVQSTRTGANTSYCDSRPQFICSCTNTCCIEHAYVANDFSIIMCETCYKSYKNDILE